MPSLADESTTKPRLRRPFGSLSAPTLQLDQLEGTRTNCTNTPTYHLITSKALTPSPKTQASEIHSARLKALPGVHRSIQKSYFGLAGGSSTLHERPSNHFDSAISGLPRVPLRVFKKDQSGYHCPSLSDHQEINHNHRSCSSNSFLHNNYYYCSKFTCQVSFLDNITFTTSTSSPHISHSIPQSSHHV